jgi:NAD(P)-dependent dehydrogenase (short-subunit alcohol dehydrogenase family)
LSGLTRALAVDLAGRVRINAVEPAAIDTPMLRAGFEGNEPAFDRLAEYHPVGRIGLPEEVARLVLLLLDPRSPFLNGAVISLDGGIGGLLHDPG